MPRARTVSRLGADVHLEGPGGHGEVAPAAAGEVRGARRAEEVLVVREGEVQSRELLRGERTQALALFFSSVYLSNSVSLKKMFCIFF